MKEACIIYEHLLWMSMVSLRRPVMESLIIFWDFTNIFTQDVKFSAKGNKPFAKSIVLNKIWNTNTCMYTVVLTDLRIAQRMDLDKETMHFSCILPFHEMMMMLEQRCSSADVEMKNLLKMGWKTLVICNKDNYQINGWFLYRRQW